MSTNFRLVIVLLVGFVANTKVVHSQGQKPSLTSPEGVKSMQLGISLSEFVQNHPDAVNYSTGVKAKDFSLATTDVTFTERINHPFFDRATYQFQNDKLISMRFKGAIVGEGMAKQTQKYLSFVLRQYGKPDLLKVGNGGLNLRANDRPDLFWVTKEGIIQAAFTPTTKSEKTLKRGYVVLAIGRSTDPLSYGKYPKLKAAEIDSILEPVREIFAKLNQTGAENRGQVTEDITPSPEPPPIIGSFSTSDLFPCWGNEDSSLFFVTTRELKGFEAAPTDENGVVIQPRHTVASIDGKGKLVGLVQLPLGVMVNGKMSLSPAKPIVTFCASGQIVVLNVEERKLPALAQSSRIYRTTPQWSPKGDFIVASGTHSPSDWAKINSPAEVDIFFSEMGDIAGELSLVRTKCLINFPGEDTTPIFSPDGRWVFFAHQTEIQTSPESINLLSFSQDRNWSIYKMPFGENATSESKPTLIVNGLPRPSQLSWVDQGTKLMVGYPGNVSQGYTSQIYKQTSSPTIVDVENKAHYPLKLELHDPDLLQSEPLVLNDAVFNNKNQRIAFSALRWSGIDGDGASFCLYTCNLDGSDLKRVTSSGALGTEVVNSQIKH